jgi:hypothetical protein
MTVTYRTSGAWGSGKGTNLTPAEVDGNFWDHEGRIVTLEGGLPAPNEIADISVDANGMITFTMDDATAFGPYQIPIAAFGWRGDWLASTAYNLYDIVHVAGAGVYIVLKEHTSPATWNAGHTVSGVQVYDQMMPAVVPPVDLQITESAATTYELGLDDRGKYLRFTDSTSGNVVVDLPPDSVVAWPTGSQITIRQSGSAPVELSFGSFVTVNAKTGCDFTTVEEGSVVTLVKIAASEWDYFGDHGFVSV